MDIGTPIRAYTVEPIVSPVPLEAPAPPREREPVQEPSVPDLVPA